MGARGFRAFSIDLAPFGATDTGLRAGGRFSSTVGCGGGFGVSSIVECLPVVHGGISRNSSNVKTRGLQHFQPATT